MAEAGAGPRARLQALFTGAVEACQAQVCLPRHLEALAPARRVLVLGAGKAAAAMAAVTVEVLGEAAEGLVVTRYGHVPPALRGAGAVGRVQIVEAGHPVPDAAGLAAAERMLALADTAGAQDRVLFLGSGGGSSLLCCPADGVALADKQAVTRFLLRSGAPIGQINTVRKHLSRIKGGRLAAAASPAPVTALLVSDVPGDDPADIASGPTVADRTTLADARRILADYGWSPSASVERALRDPRNETPDRLDNAGAVVVARAADALDAAAAAGRAAGLAVEVLGDDLEGEARRVGAGHAALALAAQRRGGARLLLSGGELTVTVRAGDGRGGRNLEYLAGLALALDGAAGVHALAADTDGIDGSGDNAGAVITPDTLARARSRGLDAAALLDANRSYDLFAALGDLLITGPTLTNVNDFRAVLVEPR